MSPSHLGASETGPPGKEQQKQKKVVYKKRGRSSRERKQNWDSGKQIAVGFRWSRPPGIQASDENKTGIPASDSGGDSSQY